MTSTARRTLPALLLTAIVLAVAFAGGATAAKMIHGKQIKNNTVTTQDIKNKSLKGSDVRDGSLAEADLNKATKNKLNAPNVSGYEVVEAVTLIESAGQGASYVACAAGKIAVGGGGYWEDNSVETTLQASVPQFVVRGDALLYDAPKADFADGWKAEGAHNGLNPQNLTAYVICVDPS